MSKSTEGDLQIFAQRPDGIVLTDHGPKPPTVVLGVLIHERA